MSLKAGDQRRHTYPILERYIRSPAQQTPSILFLHEWSKIWVNAIKQFNSQNRQLSKSPSGVSQIHPEWIRSINLLDLDWQLKHAKSLFYPRLMFSQGWAGLIVNGAAIPSSNRLRVFSDGNLWTLGSPDEVLLGNSLSSHVYWRHVTGSKAFVLNDKLSDRFIRMVFSKFPWTDWNIVRLGGHDGPIPTFTVHITILQQGGFFSRRGFSSEIPEYAHS